MSTKKPKKKKTAHKPSYPVIWTEAPVTPAPDPILVPPMTGTCAGEFFVWVDHIGTIIVKDKNGRALFFEYGQFGEIVEALDTIWAARKEVRS